MTKAIIDFSGYTAADLVVAAQNIHDQMTANAATFATPPVTMTDFETLVGAASAALTGRASGARADVIALHVARHDLEGALNELGGYVNIVAKGDTAIVQKSSFPSFETPPARYTGPPAAPQNLVLRQGDLSGSLVARYRPDRRHSSVNEVQINTSDPNSESDWKPAGIFSGGRAVLTGLTPGTNVWVRVRTCGVKGVMGAFSDPAKLMVV